MSFADFFIDRPRFAIVLSVILVLIGGIAVFSLPIAQYPEVTPPTILVSASYPGANPKVIAETVAAPIEQEVNGVERMVYMSSQSTSDGQMQLTITFQIGTNLDIAQMQVQNRVANALPKLPEDVRRLGVTTKKSSPDILLVIHLISPNNRYDQLYLSNYALLNISDQLLRLAGVGDVKTFGAGDYSMRVWLDPAKISLGIDGRAGCLAACLLLAGCSPVGPDYREPPFPTSAKFANAAQAGISDGSTEIRWWEGFGDAILNGLVKDGLRSNPDLRIAMANLREARALRLESQFDLFPTVTMSAFEKTQRYSQDQFGRGVDRGPEFNLLNAGFDATWELDFFGRIRRSVEARTSELDAVEAHRRDAIVSLVAELARNYFELRGTQHQLAVAQKNAENQAATLKYTQARLNGGQGTALDTARAEEQLNSTLASLPPLESRIRRAIHRIAVLLGQTPGQLHRQLEPQAPLPVSPAILAIGDPAKLLQRRPDIRIAERTLAAATARIGVAAADFFPRVTFVGNVALQASSFIGMGQSGGNTNSFGPVIRWAAFDLGRVYARMKAADARAERDLANYEKTVLLALEDTENALVEYGRLQTRRDFFRLSVTAGEKAARLARLRYQDGVSDFLAVLDAERRLLETQDKLAHTETDTATALVAVYKALGGGWEWETSAKRNKPW